MYTFSGNNRRDSACNEDGMGALSANAVFHSEPKRAVSLLQLGYCILSGYCDRFRFFKKSVRSRIVIQQLAEARQGLSSLAFNQSVDC